MDPIYSSNYKNGYWTWDEFNNGLLFVSRDTYQKLQSATNVNIQIQKTLTKQSTTEMKFRETVDLLEQARFRRHHQRRCKPMEPRVITIQDIKDIVIFLTNANELTRDFIKYFHLPTVDRFLRSLIVYFQYYIQVWENLLIRREESNRKLYQPIVTELENRVRDDLADLRAMVSREYCYILMGAADAKKYHHMNNKNNTSLSDNDRKLFETLIGMAVRVVWIALQRRSLSLIENEMNRLLRTEIFNFVSRRRARGVDSHSSSSENRVLRGPSNVEEKKLLHRSPIVKELILGEPDYRMLIIGIKQYEPLDSRLEYLEVAFSAPEECLMDMGITIGMLGLPRDDYDPMLMNLVHTAKKRLASKPRLLPVFKLPLPTRHSDRTMPQEFPKNFSKYKDTKQTLRSRKIQSKMWCKVIEKRVEAKHMSVLDLSTTQSHMLLLASRSSVSVANRSMQ